MSVPVQVKKTRGTWRDDRDGGKIDMAVMESIPVPPDDFDERQKDIWLTVLTELKSIGILHVVGLPLLEIYCREVRRYYEAQAELDEKGITITTMGSTGNVVTKANPAAEIANAAYAKIIGIAKEFGFTPAGATKIKVSNRTAEHKDPDFNF